MPLNSYARATTTFPRIEEPKKQMRQSVYSSDMYLAFERFHEDDCDEDFVPLITEVLILSQPLIQSHPNIVSLEEFARKSTAVPVFVFK